MQAIDEVESAIHRALTEKPPAAKPAAKPATKAGAQGIKSCEGQARFQGRIQNQGAGQKTGEDR